MGANAEALVFWLFSTLKLTLPSVLRIVERLVRGMTMPERATVSASGFAATRNGRAARTNAREKCMANRD